MMVFAREGGIFVQDRAGLVVVVVDGRLAWVPSDELDCKEEMVGGYGEEERLDLRMR